MTGNTKIAWTNKTWNPIVGCSIVSAGCTNCYAMKWAGARLDGNPKAPQYAGTTKKTKAGAVWTGKVAQANDNILGAPLRWQKPAMIFVNSMGDLFHEDIPDAWVDQVFIVMALAGRHTFQILTKRPDRMRDYLAKAEGPIRAAVRLNRQRNTKLGNPNQTISWPLPNVWVGVSIEDQKSANARIPQLLTTPASLHWVSAEPLLDELSLTQIAVPNEMAGKYAGHGYTFNALQREDDLTLFNSPNHLKWVVTGGESGPRPTHPDWFRVLRNQCADAGTAFFFKQWGNWAPGDHISTNDDNRIVIARDGRHFTGRQWLERGYPSACLPDGPKAYGSAYMRRLRKNASGNTLDGVQHHAYPEAV